MAVIQRLVLLLLLCIACVPTTKKGDEPDEPVLLVDAGITTEPLDSGSRPDLGEAFDAGSVDRQPTADDAGEPPCQRMSCGPHGHCEEQGGVATCVCDPDYVPTDTGCVLCERAPLVDLESDPSAGVPFGYLDDPLLEDSASGRTVFAGWVLAAEGVERTELHIDGLLVSDLTLDAQRPDVCAAFPNLPCELGFRQSIDLYWLSECDHVVEIYATDQLGNTELIDHALLHVTKPPRGYRVGEAELVHRVDSPRITQALDMIVDDADHVIACFGSWHAASNNYDSFCRDLETGAEERGHGRHETAGVGLDKGAAGVLIGFEADDARDHGGPGLFGSGLAHDDGGAHFWQAVSIGHGFAIAAAARISGLNVDIYLGENDGAGPWNQLGTSGLGVAHRQLFHDPYHLIFTTRYQSSGTPRMIRVNSNRQVTTVTYSGLPNGCEGIGTAAEIPTVGLVAGTYSDQLPWRGGSCGAVGLLDAETGATSGWRTLAAADVIDIVPLDNQGYFAVSVNFPARVILMDPDLHVTDTIPLVGPHVGGLALHQDMLYAASAGPGIGARVFRFPLHFNEQGPATRPQPDRAVNLIWRQREQSCSSCGIWFDWEGQQGNKPRLVVEYTVNGQQQTKTYQHGNSNAGPARSVTISPNRATRMHSMLIKQTPTSHALFWADISDIDASAQIDSATIHLHIESAEGLANSDNSSVIQALVCQTAWDESVSWSQASAGQAWSSAGGDLGPVVRSLSAGTDMHGRGFNKVNNNIHFDFTEYVRSLF